MSDGEVKVSILCLAYNHARYIRQTLDGFVSQKTNFAYEILIHDDASTDETADIINEYAARYPELIRPIFQTVNQHSQKIPIWKTHVNALIRGKYVALCEGDDYWTDPDKLQKQFDIMESHPECSMCVHTIQEIRDDGTPTSKFRPSKVMAEGSIDTAQFLAIRRQYPFQTGSFFIRTNLWLDFMDNPPAFRRAINVGDEPLLLYMAAHGKIYYLPECMSVYRIFSMGSWSSLNKRDPVKRLERAKKVYEMMCLYDEYTGHVYNCDLALYKGDVLWYSEEYRELLRKENRAYVNQLNVKRRYYVYVCAVFPFLKSIRNLRRQVRQKLKGERQ